MPSEAARNAVNPGRRPGARALVAAALALCSLTAAGCDWSRFYPDYDIPDANAGDLPFDPPDDWVSSDDGLPGFTITSVDPLIGPVTGGTRVSIEGRGFSAGSRVFFGQAEGVETIVENDTSIKSTTPGGTGYTETVDVSVVRPDGKRTTVRPGFQYVADVTVTSVTPSAGPVEGGTPIVIRGAGFAPDSDVVLDGRSAIQVRRVDDSTILALTPPGETGRVEVLVLSSGARGRLAGGFSYVARPASLTCSPAVVERSPGAGLVSIRVSGLGAGAATAVSLSAGTVITTRQKSQDSVEVVADLSTASENGPVDVSVAGAWGTTSAPACFVALDATAMNSDKLTIYAVHPSSAPAAGGTSGRLVVTGLDYGAPDAFLVRLGESPGSVTAVPDMNTVEFLIGAGQPGTVDVTLESPTETAVLKNGFTYLPARSVSGILPATVAPASTADAVISGSGLKDAVEVMAGPLPATIKDAPSDDSIAVRLPPLEAGLYDITVLMSDGSHAALASALTVVADTVSVKSISPDRGSMAGGTFAWLTGSGLGPGTRVFFGNREASILDRGDPGRMAISTPPADEIGTVDVFVVGADGVRQRLANAFNYFDPTGPFGGVWGGAISGSVNVTVLDSYTDDPIPGAFVMLGSDAGTPFKGFTDGRGMVTLSGRRLGGPVMMTATRQDYTTYSIAGTDGENMTVFLEPLFNEIPDTGDGGEDDNVFPLTPGMVSGYVTGTDKEFIAPAATCAGMPLVNGPLCRLCSTDAQCGDGWMCVTSGPTAMTCSRSCSVAGDCPDGYDCYATADRGSVCKPAPGRPEIRCAVSDSSSSRWSDPFGPGAIADKNGRWALNSRLGEVAVYCLGGYRRVVDNEYVPVVMGILRHLQVQTSRISSGNVVRLDTPLTGALRARMIAPPDGSTGPSVHTAYLTLFLGSDGYLNLWTPDSLANGRIFDFTRLPRDLSGALEDARYIVTTEATSPTSTGDPYSTVSPAVWTPERHSPLFLLGADVSSPSIDSALDVLSGCSSGGRGIVVDSSHAAWLVDSSGFISALPGVGDSDIDGCAWLPDGRVMFFGDRSWVHYLDPDTLEQTSERISAAAYRLVAAAATPDGTIWAAAENRLFVRAGSGGWRQIQYGSPARINALADAGDGTIVGVGDAGLVFSATASGASPATPVVTADLYAVAASEGILVAVGTGGTVLKGADPASLSPMAAGIQDDLLACAADSGGGFVAAGTRGAIVRVDRGGTSLARAPSDKTEITSVIPLAQPGDEGSFIPMMLFRRSSVMAGPFLGILKFTSPPENWLWLDRTLKWTIATPPLPSFFYFRMYTVGMTGRWTIVAAGNLDSIVLPDVAVASDTGISPLKSGVVSLKAYVVDAKGFDIDNYDSSSMYTSQWRAWSTANLLTRYTSAQ